MWFSGSHWAEFGIENLEATGDFPNGYQDKAFQHRRNTQSIGVERILAINGSWRELATARSLKKGDRDTATRAPRNNGAMWQYWQPDDRMVKC